MRFFEESNSNKKFYKKKYCIAFYDKTGEQFIDSFDNIRDILKHRGLPTTRRNVNTLNVELYRALRKDTHFTEMLDGRTVVTVWLFEPDMEDDGC